MNWNVYKLKFISNELLDLNNKITNITDIILKMILIKYKWKLIIKFKL